MRVFNEKIQNSWNFAEEPISLDNQQLHLVVQPYFLAPEPHFVIRIILSTCLEVIKGMPQRHSTARAAL